VTSRRPGPLGAWARPDALSGLALLLLAAFAWWMARQLPFGTLHQPGAGFFPKSLAVLAGALAAVLAIRGAAAEAPSVRSLWPERAGLARVLVMLAVLLGYLTVLERLGYLLSTAGLFLVLLRWVGRRSWPMTGAVTLLAAAGSYLLFARWLMVSLPAGLWAP
jgi:putative tricarboxylic transport membrane protein